MKQISGFKNYFITEAGEIFTSNYAIIHKKAAKLKKMKLSLVNGYWKVQLRKDGKYHRKYLHDLLLTTFKGKRKKRQVCRHLDDNRLNNNLNNLVWGTIKQNHEDRIKNGRDARGEKSVLSKLTFKQAQEIQKLGKQKNKRVRACDKGGGYKEIADKFNVSVATVARIVRGEGYKKSNFLPKLYDTN